MHPALCELCVTEDRGDCEQRPDAVDYAPAQAICSWHVRWWTACNCDSTPDRRLGQLNTWHRQHCPATTTNILLLQLLLHCVSRKHPGHFWF